MASSKQTGIKLSKQWKAFDREFSVPVQKRYFRKYVKKSTKMVGVAVEKEMRSTILTGRYEKNANLTIALKHSTRPLVDTGNMRSSVTSKMITDHSVFVGILKSDASYKNAVTVHGYNSQGAQIKVTDQMRRLFSVLADAYHGKIQPDQLKGRAAELWKKYQGPWNGLGASTTYIRIPPRPFVKQTVNKKSLRSKVQKIWHDALNENYKQLAKRVNRGA